MGLHGLCENPDLRHFNGGLPDKLAYHDDNFNRGVLLPRKTIEAGPLTFERRIFLENPLSLNQNIFAYIDALADLDSAKQLNTFLDIKSIKKVFWESFKKYFATKSALEKQKAKLKCNYINRYFCSGITLNKNINQFITPHGFYGIFISSAAKIGTGCTIFQQVTIGSNTLLDSKSGGAPTIGNNVYIGAGAKIIGNVKIGNNVRIGAGCTVTRDVPDNCTVAQGAPFVLQKKTPQNNRWVSISDYRKIKAEEKAKASPPPT